MEIKPEKWRETIIQALATINSRKRGDRAYNEMYLSNPKKVMAVFARNLVENERIDNPVKFLKRETAGIKEIDAGDSYPISVKERTGFLQQYAIEHDIPFIIFGN